VTAVTTRTVLPPPASFREVPNPPMRRTIARRLTESKAGTPHFYLNVDVRMDAMLAARTRRNEGAQDRVSLNDILVKIAADGLVRHPVVNASWTEEATRYYEHAQVGVAMAIEGGLVVPVVRDADTKSLAAIAAEIRGLAAKAKSRKLIPLDWQGNTFTVSNLGMFGIDSFTGVINPPDAALLAVGAVRRAPVVEGDRIVPGAVMTLTLCCDHRVVDGATGAAFLAGVREALEGGQLPA